MNSMHSCPGLKHYRILDDIFMRVVLSFVSPVVLLSPSLFNQCGETESPAFACMQTKYYMSLNSDSLCTRGNRKVKNIRTQKTYIHKPATSEP